MDKKLDKFNYYMNDYLDQVSRNIERYEAELSKSLESSIRMFYTGLLEASMREYSHLSQLKEIME